MRVNGWFLKFVWMVGFMCLAAILWTMIFNDWNDGLWFLVAIANRVLSVVCDARFAEHHAQHALLKCCMITWSPTFLITFVLGSELVHLLNAKVKSNATIVLAIIGLIFWSMDINLVLLYNHSYSNCFTGYACYSKNGWYHKRLLPIPQQIMLCRNSQPSVPPNYNCEASSAEFYECKFMIKYSYWKWQQSIEKMTLITGRSVSLRP